MSCLTYAARNQGPLKPFLKNFSFNKLVPDFSTSSSFLKYERKKTSSSFSKYERKKQEPNFTPVNDYTIPPSDLKDEGEQFRYLLRNSSFINMGDPENKIVEGKIFHTVKDDLYVDFGWKFYCVCSRPSKSGRLYVRGSTVLLKIKDLELSTKFLGSEKDLTLLEADASIIKLLYSPVKAT